MVAATSLISVFAAQLTAARHIARISQRKLAPVVGVPQARISAWERGVEPSLKHFVEWADALGYDVALYKRPEEGP